jgi:hypothetical protein
MSQGFRRLLHESARDGNRAHRTGKREGRHHVDLASLGEAGEPVEQLLIDAARRIDVDRGEHRGLVPHFIERPVARNRNHVDRILGAETRDCTDHHRSVGVTQQRVGVVEMPRGYRQIERLDHRPADNVNNAERVVELHKIA